MPSIDKKEPEENLSEKVRSFFSSRNGQKKKNALPPKTHFSIWYFILAVLLLTYLQQYLFSPKVETISYSQFKQGLAEGSVTKLIIGPENITGAIKGKDKKQDQRFTTVRVDDPNLMKELDEHKVDYSGLYESKFLGTLLSWVVPIIIFFMIWRYANGGHVV